MLPKNELVEVDAIRASAMPMAESVICGVYFLLRAGELIYVGQSINIRARLTEHLNKRFDSYTYIRCAPAELDDIETAYILKYKPSLNGCYPGGRKNIPGSRGIDFVLSGERVAADVIPLDGLTRGQRTANRRDRDDYNAYMREYMKKRRAK